MYSINNPPPSYDKAVDSNANSSSQIFQNGSHPTSPPCYDPNLPYNHPTSNQSYIPSTGINPNYPNNYPNTIIPPPGSITVVSTPYCSTNSRCHMGYRKRAFISFFLFMIFVAVIFTSFFLLLFVAGAGPQVIALVIFGEFFLFFVVIGVANFFIMKKYNIGYLG